MHHRFDIGTRVRLQILTWMYFFLPTRCRSEPSHTDMSIHRFYFSAFQSYLTTLYLAPLPSHPACIMTRQQGMSTSMALSLPFTVWAFCDIEPLRSTIIVSTIITTATVAASVVVADVVLAGSFFCRSVLLPDGRNVTRLFLCLVCFR